MVYLIGPSSLSMQYHLFVKYYQEIFNSFDDLYRIAREHGYIPYKEEFLECTKELIDKYRDTQFCEMLSEDFEPVITEIIDILKSIQYYFRKSNLCLWKLFLIDDISMKLFRLKQLAKNVADNISKNEEGSLFDCLPDIVLVNIFNNLPLKDRIDVELVNKRWCQLSRSSWGLLKHLTDSDLFAIQGIVFPYNPCVDDFLIQWHNIEVLKKETQIEIENRLIKILSRMRDWETNTVDICLNLIGIMKSNSVSEETAKSLDKLCPNITSISLKDANSSLLKGKFSNAIQLEITTGNGSEISYEEFDQGHFPHLELLTLEGSFYLNSVAKYSSLKILELEDTNITNKDCTRLLSNCPVLEGLNICNTKVTSNLVSDWFRRHPVPKGKFKFSLIVQCDEDIFLSGEFCKYSIECKCHGDDDPGIAAFYESWCFAIDIDKWSDYKDSRTQILRDTPTLELLDGDIMDCECWSYWFPWFH